MIRTRSFLAAVLITLFALPAVAQNPPAGTPARIRGTVDKLDGHTLTIKSRDGELVTVALADNFIVRAVVKRHGGRVLVESESSCTVYGMPRAISEAGLADGEMDLSELARAVTAEAGA